MEILTTRNSDWGFYGTIDRIETRKPVSGAQAWEIASRRIGEVTTASPDGIRDFLDSRQGRHFADDVAGELSRGDAMTKAIDVAIARWMDWRINRETSRETGIPRDLPYLAGLAGHFDIMAEIAD